MTRIRSRKLLTAAALLASCATVFAQAWPTRPVTIVVGYPAGAGTDIIARTVAEKLAPRLGQPVVVENRVGASGVVGVSTVARAPADGHMVLVAPNTVYIAPHVLSKGTAAEQAAMVKDLVPVVQLSTGTMVMVATPSLGVKNAQELAAKARQQPGITYASPGSGSPMHIAGELFKRAAKVDMNHVPYKGSAPAMTDLIGGHVQTLFGVLGSVEPHIQSGKMVPLAVVQKERSPLAPQVPSMAELGFPNVETKTWYGVLAPKGTPAPVLDRLNREINAVLDMPDVRDRIRGMREAPVGGSADAFREVTQREFDTYGRIVKEFGIAAD
ncbi:tripartite tricarboxylate transporter substrate binding protein [Ramlibacter sp. AW1]|uniref:Tripartite tricarboxylate transporter substrate binding protein n=1 Tax=Ramlibacter aurantiacus TaxID=2801330 RepID=A0A936ZDN0_9BURK|nr:tripartite tricarboxylate transporter substrate binding protein [Ramlibacter aurantiacus]MBL0419664.1 tripartite tricarboxylate transporter substrate binding protein [Ramlibacter aurantiacus]